MKVFGVASILVCFLVLPAIAQGSYPSMAPVSQYLMQRDEEISLARSAAPKSISDYAEILVFTKTGFQTAVKGTNGFVCMVARSWSADYDNADFWDPRLRAPICYNAAAAKSQVAITMKRTQLALSGESNVQISSSMKAAIESGELPKAEAGSMSYMLSRGTYLSNRDGRWLPHIMFFLPATDAKSWGAGLPGSPILAFHPEEGLTVFIIPVSNWSDGTPAQVP